jgi:hypothetical protein
VTELCLFWDGGTGLRAGGTSPSGSGFRAAHLPEYRRRLLHIYAACAGWSRPAVAPLWPFVEAASRAFELGALEPWRLALEELERRVGMTG